MRILLASFAIGVFGCGLAGANDSKGTTAAGGANSGGSGVGMMGSGGTPSANGGNGGMGAAGGAGGNAATTTGNGGAGGSMAASSTAMSSTGMSSSAMSSSSTGGDLCDGCAATYSGSRSPCDCFQNYGSSSMLFTQCEACVCAKCTDMGGCGYWNTCNSQN